MFTTHEKSYKNASNSCLQFLHFWDKVNFKFNCLFLCSQVMQNTIRNLFGDIIYTGHCSAKLNVFLVQLLRCGRERSHPWWATRWEEHRFLQKADKPTQTRWPQCKVQVQKGQKLIGFVLSKIGLLGIIKENLIRPGLGC